MKNQLDLPPSPSRTAIAQTLGFFTSPFTLIRQARQECGDLFTLRLLGLGSWVVLCNTELATQLHRLDDGRAEAGGIRSRMLGSLLGNRMSIGLDGEPHQRRRRAEARQLGMHGLRSRLVELGELLGPSLDRWPRQRALDVQPLLDQLSLRLILHILLSDASRVAQEVIFERALEFLARLQSPFVMGLKLKIDLGRLSPWGRYLAARRDLYSSLDEIVDQRLAGNGEEDDLFAALLTSPLEDSPEAQREAVIHEVAGLLVGGSETTAKSIAWVLAALLDHPTALRRLRQEVDEVLADRPLDAESLDRMPYLDAVVKEGLRTQPLVPLIGHRVTVRQVELGGFTFPPGTVITQAPTETGRSDRFPCPDRFEPNNFLGRAVGLTDYLPFGGGRRICTGMALAQLEIALVLASLIQRFDIERTAGSLEPQAAGLAFKPRNLRLMLVERR